MSKWRQYTVEVTSTSAAEQAEKLGLDKPKPKRARIAIDLQSVTVYWESSTEEGEPATAVETIGGEVYEILLPYDEFKADMCREQQHG